MESHEEKLLAMVQESKMNQAREIMKQKERELKAQQPAASGLSYFASFFTSAVSNVASTVRQVDSSVSGVRESGSSNGTYSGGNTNPSTINTSTINTSSLGRGMKLGMGKKESLSVGEWRESEL